jgi:hypothetical protein
MARLSEIVIKKFSGCTNNAIEVDGKSINGMSNKELCEIIDIIVKEIKREPNLNFVPLLESIEPDEWDMDDDCCDQCGDSFQEETWRFNK